MLTLDAQLPAGETDETIRPAAKTILTLLSMLGEGVEANSATRMFKAAPVLDATLRRLLDARLFGPTAILCWDDQLADVEPIARRRGAEVRSQGRRIAPSQLQAIAAAKRWSDGWRCGPLGVSAFDGGFHAPAVREAAEEFAAGAVMLIDPAAGLLDPQLIADIARRWWSKPSLDFTFAPTAPGLAAMLIGKPLLDRLATANLHPGRLLAYFPDQVSREPTSGEGCVPAPTPAARSLHTFAINSQRQIEKLSAAPATLNGQLATAGAEAIATRLNALNPLDRLPREVTLELTTRRLSKPIFSPLVAGPIVRQEIPYEAATRLIDELSALDDARLTLGGVGDPLLHGRVIDIIDYAAAHGVAVNVETDLLTEDATILRLLSVGRADVISVHLPALTDVTYQKVMNIDGYRRAMENLQRLVAARAAEGNGTPLVIPLFTKCRENLAEMEPWYDQWLRAVGSAAILGPTTFGGMIPDVSAADMTPPRRVACRRLGNRLMVLSDGSYATCEQDVLGAQAIGKVGQDALSHVWQTKFEAVRNCHRDGRWSELPLCKTCKEWHRP